MDRSRLKQLPGYLRLLSMGAEDKSGPQMQKTGAFKFEKQYDYGTYNITKDGLVKRQSVTPFKIGTCDMKTEASYNKAFNDIAEKMIQIKEKENKAIEASRQKDLDNEKLIDDVINHRQAGSHIKYRNIIKDLFANQFSAILDDREIKFQILRYVKSRAEELIATPGGPELYILLRKK